MEKFETVNKATIINSRGVKYLDFRNQLTPKYALVWFDIFLGYFALISTLLATGFLQKSHPRLWIVTIPAGSFLVGYAVAYIHLFMHEASHYNIAGDKRTNDLLANLFIGLLVGLDIRFYRTMHASHHRYLGTTIDTEKSYFDPITWRFVIETLTGIRVLKVITHRNKNMLLNEGADIGTQTIRKNNRLFLSAVLLNLIVVSLFFASGYWHVGLVWIIGMGAVFPFFAAFRQVLEHRSFDALSGKDYNAEDHGEIHRMFGDGPIAATMGPAGFNRHLLHHWDPQVSYTRFKEVEIFLNDTFLKEDLKTRQTTYFRTFVGLLNKRSDSNLATQK